MNWYYVSNGQQVGPMEDAQLAELVRNGSILFDTLVWHEGMANWQPYGHVQAPPAPPVTIAAVPPVVGGASGLLQEAACAECGRLFNKQDMIAYSGSYVCAACKPVFLQRVREGAPLTSSAIRGVTEAELLARDYQVDIGGCLSRGWAAFTANAGMMIAASVLAYLAMCAAGIIPYLGIVTSLIFNGPLLAGLWVFYIKTLRKQPAGIEVAFSGFSKQFWQYVMVQLIPFLITIGIAMVAGLVFAMAGVFTMRGGRSPVASGVPVLMFAVLGVVFLIVFVVMMYFNICWLFAMPLVGDKGLKFWPAMQLSRRVVSKHWWMTLLLVIVSGLVALAGMLACCIGMVVSGPVAFSMIACHYEKVFGDLTPSQGSSEKSNHSQTTMITS